MLPLRLTSWSARLLAVLSAVAALLMLGAPVASADVAAETQFITLLNQARAANGLPAYSVTADLTEVARAQAQRMASSGTLYHNPNLATDVTEWTSVGENVGYGPSPQALNSALLASPGHRANMLSGTFTQVGVGAVWSGGTLWMTQVYRRPTAVAAALPNTFAPAPPPAPPKPSDLSVVLPAMTASGKVEVHTLTGASWYRQYSQHVATALDAQDPSQWAFFTAPWAGSGRPDLIGVKFAGTSSGKVEVHVLSAASGYTQWVAHIATALPVVDPTRFQFALGSLNGDSRPNLYAIMTGGTASGRTEVHVLSAASGYQAYAAHAATALPTTSNSAWRFLVGATGPGDVVGVLRSGASGRTEVHRLSASTGWSTFNAQVATPLEPTTASSWYFALGSVDGDAMPDLFTIPTAGTGSGQTEAHVLSGASTYSAFVAHVATALPLLPMAAAFNAN